MTPLAVIRADSVNFPLFLHVLGAMVMVGLLLAVASAILIGWRRTDDSARGLTRAGLWTLLVGVIPAWILMRTGAGWTESREFPTKAARDAVEDQAWLGIGFLTADAGAILILLSAILAIVGLVRLRSGRGTALGRAVGIVATVLVAAYVVAVWAMTTKPG
jgi:uncharacterized membrane protein YhiD involved in acid resistance